MVRDLNGFRGLHSVIDYFLLKNRVVGTRQHKVVLACTHYLCF